MSFVEVLQLIGYSFGAWLHLWIGVLLAKQRTSTTHTERVLLWLIFCLGGWHVGNLGLTLLNLLTPSINHANWLIRVFETFAVIAITLSYSLLLHVHLHLWAQAHRRPLTLIERARVLLSYVPLAFLFFAVPALWLNGEAPMLAKLTRVEIFDLHWNFVVAFACWAAYALCVVGVTDLLLAKAAPERRERTLMLALGASFLFIAGLIPAVHVLRIGASEGFGDSLQTFANLSSLLPTALLVYHIYRYRYLELVIRDSLVVALFAVVVLVSYLYGVRAISATLTARYGLRAGVIDSLLILALALVAAPLRGWLEHHFTRLLSRETSLYREVLARIGTLSRETRRYRQLPELLEFVARRSETALGLRRVQFITGIDVDGSDVNPSSSFESDNASTVDNPSSFDKSLVQALWSRLKDSASVEDLSELREHGWCMAYAIRRESELLGALLIDAPRERLTADVRRSLMMLADQVALAVAESRLIEENLRLERRLAQDERLAELGRMAATVAHEVKNPLSAIKSIAQVMREDERLAEPYTRDLDLIVGEADRLGRSVTHLLKWARHETIADTPATADDVATKIVRLFEHEASERGISLAHTSHADPAPLDGKQTAALRDALTNLVANALQATPHGGSITISINLEAQDLIVRVTDTGTGVPSDLGARIWQPFFTTRQRGTGLGLAIVRKRMEEVKGAARLIANPDGTGACFELRLRVPVDDSRSTLSFDEAASAPGRLQRVV